MIKKVIKSLGIGMVAVIMVTVGIDAADHYDNLSESLVGRLVLGEEEGPCPIEMSYIPTENGGFCIDKYEASAGDGCPYSEISNQSETRTNLDFSECRPESKEQASPWRFISQSQSAAACAKASKRMPTDEEWYLASLGTPDIASGWTDEDCQVNSNWPHQPGKTGSADKCVSPYGVYDMVGNVWEWVKGEIRGGLYNGEPLPDTGYISAIDIHGVPVETVSPAGDKNFNSDYLWIKESGVRGMARGGYWDNKSDAGIYAMYLVSPPSFAGTGIGFRCAR